MEKSLQVNNCVTSRITSINFWRGLGRGLIGGLAGTMIMDLVLIGAFSAVGWPVLTCFSIIGNTIAGFFSIQNMEMAGPIQMGIAMHYLIGPLIGAIFGMAVVRVKALRVDSMRKSILLAILYVEILSQPLLATTPILLKMTLNTTLLWYGGAFVMHMIAAVVLGAVVGRGLRLPTADPI